MAFGRIPRFSPSFSPVEAAISLRWLAQGTLDGGADAAKVAEWERSFADYIGARNAVMVPSARFGFYLLLKSLGVGEGDEVIVPGLTYFAIPAMVPLLGAKPVFADVGLRSHVLDPEALRGHHAAHQGGRAHPPVRHPMRHGRHPGDCRRARNRSDRRLCAEHGRTQPRATCRPPRPARLHLSVSPRTSPPSGAMVTTDEAEVARPSARRCAMPGPPVGASWPRKP